MLPLITGQKLTGFFFFFPFQPIFLLPVPLIPLPVTTASSWVKTCPCRCVCLTLSSWVTSTLPQCRVLSVPPTAAAKGKLLLSVLTVQKCTTCGSFVWFISIMLASAALVVHIYMQFYIVSFFPLRFIDLFSGFVRYFQVMDNAHGLKFGPLTWCLLHNN